MKFKKLLNCSLAMAIVFGAATVATGCGKDDDKASLENSEQYQIYKKALAAGATDLSYEDWLVSIKGAKGDKGDTGHTPVITVGQNGNWHVDGIDTGTKAQGAEGSAGSKWTAATSVPSDSMGNNGDMHLDILTQKIYRKENGKWVEKVAIEDGENGRDAREIKVAVNGNYIQWGYLVDGEVEAWFNLVGLDQLKGEEGDTVQLQKTTTHIQYSYDGVEWKDLIALDILKGADGHAPVVTIVNGNWHVDGVDTGVSALGAKGEQGKDGASVVNVLTSADKWGIEITHTFIMSDDTVKETTYKVVDPFKVYAAASEEEINTLLDLGVSKIGLLNDIELTKAIVIDSKVTVYLNDCKLNIPGDEVGDGVFHVIDGGDLTIEGDGTVDGASAYNDYGMVVWAEGGNVTINGGVYTNIGTKSKEDNGVVVNNNEVIYASCGGTVTINNGVFMGENPRWTLNSHNVNKGTITVNGGVFVNFNPSEADTHDLGVGVLVNYLGEDSELYAYGEYYVVEKSETVFVASEQDLVMAIQQGVRKIALVTDLVVEHAIEVDTKVTIDLNGHNITIINDEIGDGVFHVLAGGDLTIEGDGIVNGASDKNDYGMVVWAEGGKVTINGGTYTNVGTKDKEDNGVVVNNNEVIYASDGGYVVINDGVFHGQNNRWVLNVKNDEPSTVIVNGGAFVGFNPAQADTDDLGAGKLVNYVGEGYKVVSVFDEDLNTTIYGVLPENQE